MNDDPEQASFEHDEVIAGDDEATPVPDPAPQPARAPQRSRLRHAARLLLAPVLATMAIGVHWVLNVPPGGVKVSDKDQGAGKADPKKKPKAKKKGGFEPRPLGEVEAAWERYREVDFEAEPIKSAWARPHQSLINKAVTLARKTAFEGAPEDPRVTVTDVECRTVRCRFVLRSPFAHEVDMLSETLSRLESESQPVWRNYTTTKIEPPTADSPKSDTYLQVMVAFREDSMDSASFAVPEDAIAGGAAGETEDDAPRRPLDDDDDDDKNGPRDSD